MISSKYKIAGIVFILTGLVLTAVYSLHRVDLSMPVLAVHSSYLSTKYFTIIRTNIFEELIFLSFFAGFLLTAFSKEKVEHESYPALRGKAWQVAILINSSLLVFFTLFVFGKGFMMILIFNLFSTFIFYHIIFWLKKRKFERNRE